MSEFLSPDDPNLTDRGRALIRVGREAIAARDEEKLDAYYASNYKFHGPNGDSGYPELKVFFASWRKAFAPFSCERRFVMSKGPYISARTTMSGTFSGKLEDSVVEPIEPNGNNTVLELVNLSRYNDDGLLEEEWVQYENANLLKQLGVTVSKK